MPSEAGVVGKHIEANRRAAASDSDGEYRDAE
jgi:hypothetical protein